MDDENSTTAAKPKKQNKLSAIQTEVNELKNSFKAQQEFMNKALLDISTTVKAFTEGQSSSVEDTPIVDIADNDGNENNDGLDNLNDILENNVEDGKN
jgi:hypothetical protein